VKSLEQLTAEVQSCRENLNAIDAPYSKKVNALEAEWMSIRAAPHKALDDAEKAVSEFHRDTSSKEAAGLVNEIENGFPTVEKFDSFCRIAQSFYNKGFMDFFRYSTTPITPIQTRNVPFLKLLAIDEGRKKGGTKFYGAWSEKTGKLVGLLSIDPAKHPADSTKAFGLVNGKVVVFEEDTFTGIKRPLLTWIGLLRTVSEQEAT